MEPDGSAMVVFLNFIRVLFHDHMVGSHGLSCQPGRVALISRFNLPHRFRFVV